MLRVTACERNKEPILRILKDLVAALPFDNINCFEVASGSGQHAAHFTQQLPQLTWQPSDIDPKYLASIRAYKREYEIHKLLEPIELDVTEPLPECLSPESFCMVYSSNLVHISPPACTQGLLEVSSTLLLPNGLLVMYGPFKFDGVISPDSNVNFNEMLKSQNPEWGLRDVSDLKSLAATHKMEFVQKYDMPANNHILVFKKQ